ncbi:MAG: hypothetical protein CSA72_04285 [Rhodobacterales bacterium]|nr:MAG: hypothetical protein CSA72_04285 [Rhodobacterales bacterium]
MSSLSIRQLPVRIAAMFVAGITLAAVIASFAGIRAINASNERHSVQAVALEGAFAASLFEARLAAAKNSVLASALAADTARSLTEAGYTSAAIVSADQSRTPLVGSGISDGEWQSIAAVSPKAGETTIALTAGRVVYAAPMPSELLFGADILVASEPLDALLPNEAIGSQFLLQDGGGTTVAQTGSSAFLPTADPLLRSKQQVRIGEKTLSLITVGPSHSLTAPATTDWSRFGLFSAAAAALISLAGVVVVIRTLRPISVFGRRFSAYANMVRPGVQTSGDTDIVAISDILTELEAAQSKDTEGSAPNADSLINASTIPLAIIDADRRVLSTNPAFIELAESVADNPMDGAMPDRANTPLTSDLNTLFQSSDLIAELMRAAQRDTAKTEFLVGNKNLELRLSPVSHTDEQPVSYLLEAQDVTAARLTEGLVGAIEEHNATIQFDLQGNVLTANENFLKTMGYTATEIVGMHHSAFVPKDERTSADYGTFWPRLRSGEQLAGKFRRVAKDGREVWLEAAYNPIRDASGHPYTVVKYASDVTQLETLAFDRKAVLDAIGRAQAVFEMDAKGAILAANDNFCSLMGCSAEDLIGRPLASILDENFANGPAYREMQEKISAAQFDAQVYLFKTTTGETIHLQGASTPVLNRDGEVFKVIACVADVTDSEERRITQEQQNAAMAEMQTHVVDEMRKGLTRLADGDLSVQIKEPFGASYDQLRMDFNTATRRLEEAIAAVVENTGGIRNEASEIARAADDLSRRTENQAATLEQTSASLEELTASVKSAADGAEKANRNVMEARSNAEASGSVVDDAISAMSAIENSSRQISQIIGVIDDIAFQTNLLALNAGVEAARAGDAGRGFAVVASEVRALAQRSSEAAKEIKALISTSSEQVGSGVELVGQTGTALRDILSSVTSISALVEDIANTAREQSVGIGEINAAVNQIDQVTQQNAAMVEESTAASHSMTQEAEQLARLVSQFDISKSKAPPAPRPAQSAPRPVPSKAPVHGNTALDLTEEEEAEWDEF